MDALAALLAERDIERLLFDYVACNDAGDWDRLAAFYTPDGRMSRPTAPDDFICGREAILAAFRARPPRKSRHVCANVRIMFETESRALVASQILLFTAGDKPPLVGSYDDVCVRQSDGWRFAERRGSLDFPPV